MLLSIVNSLYVSSILCVSHCVSVTVCITFCVSISVSVRPSDWFIAPDFSFQLAVIGSLIDSEKWLTLGDTAIEAGVMLKRGGDAKVKRGDAKVKQGWR